MKILLDNGHGKNTPGKRSPIWPDGRQLFEYAFNREIVSGIHCELLRYGIESVILVGELWDIPLEERCNRVNLFAQYDDCLLVSVHANAGGGTGWEIWTSKGETQSDKFAEYFCDAAAKWLPDFTMRFERTYEGDGRDKDTNFKILRATSCPAVLTENLFMDTERDCTFLMSQQGKADIIALHVEAIRNIINDQKTE